MGSVHAETDVLGKADDFSYLLSFCQGGRKPGRWEWGKQWPMGHTRGCDIISECARENGLEKRTGLVRQRPRGRTRISEPVLASIGVERLRDSRVSGW